MGLGSCGGFFTHIRCLSKGPGAASFYPYSPHFQHGGLRVPRKNVPRKWKFPTFKELAGNWPRAMFTIFYWSQRSQISPRFRVGGVSLQLDSDWSHPKKGNLQMNVYSLCGAQIGGRTEADNQHLMRLRICILI